VRLYRLAAEQGNADGQYSLGRAYSLGQGVPQEDAEAVRWYRLAAEQGHATAQYNMGGLYANGQGVPQDYVQAHMWFNLAAAQGTEETRTVRDEIAKEMTRQQIAEAQRLAREWLAQHQK